MALGDDDVISGNGVPASQGAFAPSENTVEVLSPQLSANGAEAPAPPRWMRLRQPMGRPRVSTMVLMSVWVAALVVYLQVRPGG
ncbi:hypothetical protein [Nocardia mexicana]|uniref:Uncharacterized protein n=1 Tax=Nocardia mexicana TaxID=279262 RepID=A0A370GDI5_9NOCA|nr:hypothetical protein [Nocardia mexicana]RDI41751.1 hypothetical protein DFR68_13130 [Nocardia mexicana]